MEAALEDEKVKVELFAELDRIVTREESQWRSQSGQASRTAQPV
ncbi:hypothetical protein PV963_03545 [Streptomyces coeruleorubidus]|nr:hypothetical protein [Streptomyces coeruleorubidus]WDV56691.1 hypothetical protein PV963_03545 [Streptomyces coeruleorubidus]